MKSNGGMEMLRLSSSSTWGTKFPASLMLKSFWTMILCGCSLLKGDCCSWMTGGRREGLEAVSEDGGVRRGVGVME